jgi:hypothetical protein
MTPGSPAMERLILRITTHLARTETQKDEATAPTQ